MAVHHIIPKHEWKKRFGNLRGFNAVDNLSPPLYTEQHAQVHEHYYNEITHLEYDRIAGLAISGQIGKEEARIKAAVEANTGKSHIKGRKFPNHGTKDPQWRLEQSIRLKGNTNSLGDNWSEPRRYRKSIAMIGNKNATGCKHPKVTCPHCGKTGGSSGMKHYHFDNCERKL